MSQLKLLPERRIIVQEFYHSFSNQKFDLFYNRSNIEKSEEDFEIHIHDLYEIYYFINGDVTYYIDGHGYHIGAGDLLLINNQEIHKPVFNSNLIYERMAVHFAPWYFSKYSSDDFNVLACFEERQSGHFNRISSSKMEEYQIDRLLKSVEEYLKKEIEGKEIILESIFVQILYLLNQAFEKNRDHDEDSIIYDEKVSKVIRFINNNLEKKFSLDMLAREFYLDKYYLSHLFKENTGFSLIQYINYKKIMKARELLSKDYSCGEVSEKLSFGDYSNFYKSFKKETGISPSEYQQKSLLY